MRIYYLSTRSHRFHDCRDRDLHRLRFLLPHLLLLELLRSTITLLIPFAYILGHRLGRILRSLSLCPTVGEAVAQEVRVPAEEERDRVPLLARPVDHPVDVGLVPVVGPPHEHVAQVDDVGALDGLDLRTCPSQLVRVLGGVIWVLVSTHVEPLPRWDVQHLQTVHLILQQKSNCPEVLVRSDPAVELLVRVPGLRWIVQQPERRDRSAGEVVKVRLVQVERERDDAQDVLGQLERRAVVRVGGILKALGVPDGLGPLVRPAAQLLLDEVRVVFADLVADVEALLQLRVRARLEDLRAEQLVAAVPRVVV